MDDTSGFYKLGNGELLFAPNAVNGPGFALHRDNPDDRLAKQGGWQWFDSDVAAYAYWGISPTNPPSDKISPLQARLELLAAGKLDAVEAAIATQPVEVQLAWKYATEFDRTSPLLNGMAQAVGIAPAELDAMFANGKKRKV